MLKEIKLFNVSPSQKLYEKILNFYFPNRHKCKICTGEIYYKNSKFRIKKSGDLEILYKSFQTTKKHGEKLKVCERCLLKKFVKYNDLNKGKLFNTLNKITLYAFDIKTKNLEKYKTGPTLYKLIKKYGKEEGQKRWDSYREKQAYSNSLEYKKERYGWSSEQFDKFNKSRGITLDNLIKKYGEEKGKKKWEIYLKKQRKTKSFDYMVKKFGLEKAKEINRSKASTLENFMKKYGNKAGKDKFNEFINKPSKFYSEISQKLFNEIDIFLAPKYTTYYASKNTEYGVMTLLGHKRLDYYIKELNIAIEFNGDVFHGNPVYFNERDYPHPFDKSLSCKHIWQKDKVRYETLREEHGINTIVIWESEYRDKKFNILNFLEKHGILF